MSLTSKAAVELLAFSSSATTVCDTIVLQRRSDEWSSRLTRTPLPPPPDFGRRSDALHPRIRMENDTSRRSDFILGCIVTFRTSSAIPGCTPRAGGARPSFGSAFVYAEELSPLNGALEM